MKWRIGIIATVSFAASCIATAHVRSDRSSDSSRRLLGRVGPEDFDEGRPRVKEQPKVPILDSNGFAAHEGGAPSIDDLTKRTPNYALSPRPQALDTSHQVLLEGTGVDDHVDTRMADREYSATTPNEMGRAEWRRTAIQDLKKAAAEASPEDLLEMTEMNLQLLRDVEESLQGVGFSLFDGIAIRAHAEIAFVIESMEATAPGKEAILKFEYEQGAAYNAQNHHQVRTRPKRSKSGDLSPPSKRESSLNSIEETESGTLSGNEKASQSTAEFEMYLAAFQNARANASEIIMPVIQKMTSGTNSSLVFGAAWSLYSDLTFSSPYVMGPFTHGVNCLTWIEDNIFNITQHNVSDPVQKRRQTQILALDQMLLDLYNEAWANATAALNQTGLLTEMMTLAQYLSPADQSVIPPAYTRYSSPAYDTSFFTASRNNTNH